MVGIVSCYIARANTLIQQTNVGSKVNVHTKVPLVLAPNAVAAHIMEKQPNS